MKNPDITVRECDYASLEDRNAIGILINASLKVRD
jgi:hypothetical protein